MTRLTKAQINKKIDFITNYIKSKNASDGSQFDANANVDSKNIATLENELYKDFSIQLNRNMICNKLDTLGYDSSKYIDDLEKHYIYTHDETSLKPYCVSITMYPFLLEGMTKLGGESKAPKHLNSFCGSFINLVFSIASQFAGAVATVEFLMYLDYFARKDFGDDYLSTHKDEVIASLQHVIYSINQPAAARGYQCVREDTTQLATPDGFKYLSELKEGDECYVWKNGKISVQKINKLNIYDYDDELIQFKGRNYQQTVTPNHRVLYKIPNTEKYKLREAKYLEGHSKLSLPISAEHENKDDFQIADDMLILTAAILCDGSFENSNKNSRIDLYTSPNRWGGKNLPEILRRNGIGFTIKESTCNLFGIVNHIRIPSVDAQIILRYLKHNKTSLPHWIKLLSPRQAKLFIETWSKFDGSNTIKNERKIILSTKRNKGNVFSLQCDNEKIADDLQQLCFIAGIGSKKHQVHFNKVGSKNELSDKKTWYVQTFARIDKRVKEFNRIHYKGRIWCPTTDAGVVVFREENGIPYISGNSVFWNISIYDKPYFESMFGDFVFPDMKKPKWNSLDRLQRFFMKWFNQERTKAILTYPVVTAACLTDRNDMVDKGYKDFLAKELSEGNAFFIFMSENAHALSSCCRLRNDVSDQMNDFSYSLGAGGVSTGSINVMTLNLNRIIQEGSKNNKNPFESVTEVVNRVHNYQIAYRSIIQEFKDSKMLPVYDAEFITLDKQFLTVGINGLTEAAEFLGYEISNNDKYLDFVSKLFKTISDLNKKKAKETGFKFNTEMVPAENLGAKNAKWDKKDKTILINNKEYDENYVFIYNGKEIKAKDVKIGMDIKEK